MIEYIFSYDGSTRPSCSKKFTASSGETFSVSFGYENEAEREQMTDAQIYEHLDNLLLYIKDKSQMLSVIRLDEENDGDGWHLNGGWAEMMWANEEIFKWWEYVYYRPENDSAEDMV